MSCSRMNLAGTISDLPEDISPALSMHQAKRIMQQQGHWSPNQQMGLRWPIGCVALEITQRCNLDCTLCYLSEHSEAVHDIPLPEILDRIDRIHQHYGDRTDIQVTGGDPTLRKSDELIAIVSYIREKNMRSTLMTNGIRATRTLLAQLAEAGLNDVAFHVDTTQERKGYGNEIELNEVRSEYMERTRGLGLSVVFNTTVHEGNFDDLPDLVRFFVRHAASLRTVSFQLQADTGRGVEGKRDVRISMDSVWRLIEQTADTSINHRAIRTGHPGCNRYGMTVVLGERVRDLFDDEAFTGKMQAATRHITADRNRLFITVYQLGGWLLLHPVRSLELLVWLVTRLVSMSGDLWTARGHVTTLSFFVHNFMDACDLDPERIRACVFKTLTREGPVSMCEYNARRDEFILQPVPVRQEQIIRFWDPLRGTIHETPPRPYTDTTMIPRKKMKGRLKARAG